MSISQKQENTRLKDYQTTITILEHLSDAIFILNGEGHIEYANKMALDILGSRFDELRGLAFLDILDPEYSRAMPDQETPMNSFLEKINSGVLQNVEIDLVYHEYKTPAVISFGVVRDAGDHISFIIVSAKDITVRRDLEHKLSQQQMLTIARDRYRELGEMAVSLVHELSQPLTTLRLSLELTNKLAGIGEEKKEQVRANIDKMLNLVSNMTRSISNVRTFATQAEDESVKPVSLINAINEARELVSYELKNRDITLDVSEKSQTSGVLANPINLQQVFVTLIRSFWEHFDRFSPHGIEREEWDKRISIDITDNDNKWIEVILFDNIDLDVQTFLKLVNRETTDNNRENGMNLHLATARLIIHTLGGDFQAQSLPSGGRKYIIRIPVDQKEERDELFNLIEMLRE